MTENEFMLQDRIAKIKSINQMYDLENNAYVAFSGGKDSTVLHYLLDMALPNNKIPRVFQNTGIEYTEILKFVKNLASKDKRIVINIVGKNIPETLKRVGYPFKSKEHSEKVQEYNCGNRNHTLMKYFGFEEGGYRPCPKKLLYQIQGKCNIYISKRCCDEFKKKPAKEWEMKNHRKICLTGMRAEEGGERVQIRCTVFKGENLKRFHPLLVVTESFENWFIAENKIQLCKLYYPPYCFKRTGCKGCPYSMDLQAQLDIMSVYLPAERKQCEYIWKPVYSEYRRIGYRLENTLFD